MEIREISSCSRFSGKEWCPVENDGHCMLGWNINTVHDGIPCNCPLVESPIILQLKKTKKENGKEINS